MSGFSDGLREGTLIQLNRYRIKFHRINHIFISHLHGDHYLGLLGLISTMHLQGRTTELHIYSAPELREIVEIQLKYSRRTSGIRSTGTSPIPNGRERSTRMICWWWNVSRSITGYPAPASSFVKSSARVNLSGSGWLNIRCRLARILRSRPGMISSRKRVRSFPMEN